MAPLPLPGENETGSPNILCLWSFNRPSQVLFTEFSIYRQMKCRTFFLTSLWIPFIIISCGPHRLKSPFVLLINIKALLARYIYLQYFLFIFLTSGVFYKKHIRGVYVSNLTLRTLLRKKRKKNFNMLVSAYSGYW